MWFAILFICTSGGCEFVFSPPLDSQSECQRILVNIEPTLANDQHVQAYQSTCFQVKQS